LPVFRFARCSPAQAAHLTASYSFSENIWIVIQFVLDVEVGGRAPETNWLAFMISEPA
jgi:hypothetical protein